MAVELKPTYQIKQVGPIKPKLNPINFETTAVKPITQPVQTLETKQQLVVSKPNFLNELDYDVKNGATPEEIVSAYPELKGDTKLINELHYDINNGATLDEINQAYPEISGITQPAQIEDKGFLTRVGEDISKRTSDIKGTFERIGEKETSPLSGAVQTIGAVAGGIGDIFGQAITSAYKTAGEPGKEKMKQLAETDTGKMALEAIGKGAESYGEFKKQYPDVARNIESVVNVASLLPIGYGAKVTKQAGGEALEQTGKFAGKQAVKIEKKALEETRKIAEDIALPSIKELGKRQKGEVFGEVIETGKGIFKKQELVRSPKEALSIEETTRLLNEGKLKKGMSEIQKRGVVEKEIESLSEALDANLRTTDIKVSKQDMNTLFDDLSKKILDNPVIVGDAETSLKKLLPTLQSKLTKETYHPEDILKLRKDFDNAIKSAKGEGIFDPKTDSAFSTAIRDFRQGLNNKVAELVPDANVRQILDKQSALYTVSKTLNDRFSSQANTLIGRVLNKIQGVTGVPRTEIIELATAVGLAGVVSPLVAPISGTITAGYLGKKGLQYLTRPENKRKISQILRKFDDAVRKNPEKSIQIKQSKREFENIFTKYFKNDGNSASISTPIIPINTRGGAIKKPNTLKSKK